MMPCQPVMTKMTMSLCAHGTIPTFSFIPRDHVEIGEGLGQMDFALGAKVSGVLSFCGISLPDWSALAGLCLTCTPVNLGMSRQSTLSGQHADDDRHRPAAEICRGSVPCR